MYVKSLIYVLYVSMYISQLTLSSINIQVAKADTSVPLYIYNSRNVLLAVRARVCVLSLSFFPDILSYIGTPLRIDIYT